jgi:putative DNA primase/helicase
MTEPDPERARERLTHRLRDAGLDTERFIAVVDGEKKSTDHNQRAADDPRLSGNYGVYAGPGAGEDGDGWLVDVDVDDYNADADTDALDAVRDLPATLTVETPHTDGETGGHRFYRVTGNVVAAMQEVAGASNPSPSWGEVRVANQYVVGPGSQLDGCDKDGCGACATPDGGRYRIAGDRPIATTTATELADVLREDPAYAGEDTADGETVEYDADGDIDAETVAQNHDWITDYLAFGDDDRSAKDHAVCATMIEHGVGEEDARALLDGSPRTKVHDRGADYWRATWQSAVRAADPDENDETGGRSRVSTAQSGGSDGQNHRADGGTDALTPTSVMAAAGLGEDSEVSDLTDRQKAATVWELVGRSDDVHVRVRRDNGSLWAYDAGVWKPEGERALRHAARRALGSMNYGANVLTELKAQARSNPRVEVEADELGLDTGLVAVENGLVDLHAAANGAGGDALRDLRPDDLALTKLPVEYDPSAEYDEWAEYVEEWAEDGKADALAEYAGYCLHIGALPIHRALLLVGSGANGKGTFLHVVRALLGEGNTTSTELQTLANEKDAVADFEGSLANIDDDLSSRKLGAGLGMFKKLVGGDRVRARRLYQSGFEFDAVGKHLYAANEVPNVDVPDTDEAFWRRWLLVEFPNFYPPNERDRALRDRLTEDESLSGVLNWAIAGRRRLLEQGHFTGEDRLAHDKRRRWQSWGDAADEFIAECVERDDDAPRMTTGDAYRRFVAWCRENGKDHDGEQQGFTTRLKAENVGYGEHRIDGTVTRGYKSLGLSDDVPDPDATAGRGDSQQERF